MDAGAYVLSAPKELFKKTPKLIGAKIFKEKGYEVDTGGSAMLDFDNFTTQCNWFLVPVIKILQRFGLKMLYWRQICFFQSLHQ